MCTSQKLTVVPSAVDPDSNQHLGAFVDSDPHYKKNRKEKYNLQTKIFPVLIRNIIQWSLLFFFFLLSFYDFYQIRNTGIKKYL